MITCRLAHAIKALIGTVARARRLTNHVQSTDLQRDLSIGINSACHGFLGKAPLPPTLMAGIALPRASELVMISVIAVLPG